MPDSSGPQEVSKNTQSRILKHFCHLAIHEPTVLQANPALRQHNVGLTQTVVGWTPRSGPQGVRLAAGWGLRSSCQVYQGYLTLFLQR